MDQVVDVLESTLISEMASGVSTLIPLAPEIVSEIAGDDPDPKFATYIIEGGWSKSRRYYGPQVLQAISEQINNASDPIVGYQGHIPPDQTSYAFPDIQFRWVKAKIQAGGDKAKLLVKAYLLPGSKAREYVERGLKVPISISGEADMRPIRGGAEIRDYELESIDMARPRKAGMGGRLVGVTSEMEGGTEVDGKEIAALSEDDLKTHNPLLVKKIQDDVKTPLETRISEMEEEGKKAEDQATTISKLREALGIGEDADILEVVGMTVAELKKNTVKAREAILDSVLSKRFKDDAQRSLVKRILATEMETKEFPDENDDAAKVKITEMVNSAIDNDESLKSLASEMEEGGGASINGGGTEGETKRSGTREIKPGFENERISVRKVRA